MVKCWSMPQYINKFKPQLEQFPYIVVPKICSDYDNSLLSLKPCSGTQIDVLT